MTLGSAPRAVLEQVREADWGPDGESLAIVRDLGNGRDRLEYPIGTARHEATGYLSDPRVSPDGARVAFVAHPWRFDDRGAVMVVGGDGVARALTPELWSIEGLAWTPDGQTLVFSGNATGGRADAADGRAGRWPGTAPRRAERAVAAHRARCRGRRPLARRARRPDLRGAGAGAGHRRRTGDVVARLVGRAIALGRRASVADGRRGPAQWPQLRRRAAPHRRVPADAPRRRQRRTPVARRAMGGGHRRQSARSGALPDRRRHRATTRRRALRSGQRGTVVPRQPAPARLRHRDRAAAAVLPHRPRGYRLHSRHRRRRARGVGAGWGDAAAHDPGRHRAGGRDRPAGVTSDRVAPGRRSRRGLEPRQHEGLRAARDRNAGPGRARGPRHRRTHARQEPRAGGHRRSRQCARWPTGSTTAGPTPTTTRLCRRCCSSSPAPGRRQL